MGRSAECDFPELVGQLPVVMRARELDTERRSAEIDARVVATRGQNESLYVLDVPLLRTLQPDLVLTQDLCGVCSVTEEEVAAACASAGVRPRIVTLTPRTLHDVVANILTVGQAIGAEIPARGLVEGLDARMAAVRERAGRGAHRKILVVEWLDPPIVAGLWTPEMVHLAGGVTELGPSPGEPGHRSTWEEILRNPPDALILSPCSFRVERTLGEMAEPAFQRHLGDLIDTSIWVADEAYFSRPGPRLWDGIELLADLNNRKAPRAPMPVRAYRNRSREVAA